MSPLYLYNGTTFPTLYIDGYIQGQVDNMGEGWRNLLLNQLHYVAVNFIEATQLRGLKGEN